MVLTEKERKTLSYLRNPVSGIKGKSSPVDDLSDEEIVSLYNKMGAIIEEEGNIRRSFGSFDEMYVLELLGIKEILSKECDSRNLNISAGKNKT